MGSELGGRSRRVEGGRVVRLVEGLVLQGRLLLMLLLMMLMLMLLWLWLLRCLVEMGGVWSEGVAVHLLLLLLGVSGGMMAQRGRGGGR